MINPEKTVIDAHRSELIADAAHERLVRCLNSQERANRGRLNGRSLLGRLNTRLMGLSHSNECSMR
ncbi:hypothetical protein [Haloglycomyces albus]|uniref:hypothetical protein n=1 Tax=Haloglycomyces albus TaxID=526067 RepID=UPI00046C9990|nr:hypothetical protein [Haloglycomyces albus]